MPKISKEERAQLRAQLDSMDESDDAPIESAVSIMPNIMCPAYLDQIFERIKIS
jgi:hypothetical protein